MRLLLFRLIGKAYLNVGAWAVVAVTFLLLLAMSSSDDEDASTPASPRDQSPYAVERAKEPQASGLAMPVRSDEVPLLFSRRYPRFELLERRVEPIDESRRWREVVLCYDPNDRYLPYKRVETLVDPSEGDWEVAGCVIMAGDRFSVQILADSETASRRLKSLGLEIVRAVPFSQIAAVRFSKTSLDRFDKIRASLERLEAEGLMRCSVDYLATPALIPNDPDFAARQADLELINAPTGWAITTGSVESVVAVIDSGIQADHPDLAANLFENPGEIAGNGVDDDGNGLVDDTSGWDFQAGDATAEDVIGHGTAMAGIIAAVGDNEEGIAGAAWSARIAPLKAGDDFLPWTAIVQSIDYAIWLKKEARVSLAAINCSFAGAIGADDEHDLLYQALERARDADILCLAAAGNTASGGENNDASGGGQHLYPSDFDLENVLSVAATDQWDALAPTSNYGEVSVDMAAPGVSIYATTIGSGYTTLSGTSCSSARVSGVAALLHSLNGNLDAAQLKRILEDTSATAIDLVGKLRQPARLDLAAAVEESRRYPRIDWPEGYGPVARRTGDRVELTTEASSFDSQVAKVEWFEGDRLLAVDTNGSNGWSYAWLPGEGDTQVRARVTDFDERAVEAPERLFRVLNPYDFWRHEIWGVNFDSTTASRTDADPDHDGLTNLLEYAVKGSPLEHCNSIEKAGQPTAQFTITSNGLRLDLRFRMNIADADLNVTLMRWDDHSPAGWAEAVPELIDESADPHFEDAKRVKYTIFPTSLNSLYRLSISRAQEPVSLDTTTSQGSSHLN